MTKNVYNYENKGIAVKSRDIMILCQQIVAAIPKAGKRKKKKA